MISEAREGETSPYPANPPGVGDSATIAARTGTYLGAVALGVAVVASGYIAFARAAIRLEGPHMTTMFLTVGLSRGVADQKFGAPIAQHHTQVIRRIIEEADRVDEDEALLGACSCCRRLQRVRRLRITMNDHRMLRPGCGNPALRVPERPIHPRPSSTSRLPPASLSP